MRERESIMTCIVAWLEDEKICIGGDSAGVAVYNMQIRADEKVFKNGEMVFGFTSSFRMGQLLRFSLILPPKKENQDDYGSQTCEPQSCSQNRLSTTPSHRDRQYAGCK